MVLRQYNHIEDVCVTCVVLHRYTGIHILYTSYTYMHCCFNLLAQCTCIAMQDIALATVYASIHALYLYCICHDLSYTYVFHTRVPDVSHMYHVHMSQTCHMHDVTQVRC